MLFKVSWRWVTIGDSINQCNFSIRNLTTTWNSWPISTPWRWWTVSILIIHSNHITFWIQFRWPVVKNIIVVIWDVNWTTSVWHLVLKWSSSSRFRGFTPLQLLKPLFDTSLKTCRIRSVLQFYTTYSVFAIHDIWSRQSLNLTNFGCQLISLIRPEIFILV